MTRPLGADVPIRGVSGDAAPSADYTMIRFDWADDGPVPPTFTATTQNRWRPLLGLTLILSAVAGRTVEVVVVEVVVFEVVVFAVEPTAAAVETLTCRHQ